MYLYLSCDIIMLGPKGFLAFLRQVERVKKQKGQDMNGDVYNKVKELADKYAMELKSQIDSRIEEMKSDDISHYLIYRVLGVTTEEGNLTISE